jgi:hypothetical protein
VLLRTDPATKAERRNKQSVTAERPRSYSGASSGKRLPALGRARRVNGYRKSTPKVLFLRMLVGRSGMLMCELTVFLSRRCVLLGLLMLAELMVMGCLMMMVSCSVMVSRGLVMMLACRMFR